MRGIRDMGARTGAMVESFDLDYTYLLLAARRSLPERKGGYILRGAAVDDIAPALGEIFRKRAQNARSH
jgi:hypothetical protein